MKDPAFLFYSSDFLTGTQFFTNEQVGKYIRLLCAQHQHGHLSELQVNFICSTYEPDIIKKFLVDDGGLYYNERLDNEIKRRAAYCESRRNNISKRYSIKGKQHSKTVCTTYVQHMETENETINILFNTFWDKYNKKVGDKKRCEKKWAKLKDSDREKIMQTLPAFLSVITDKQFQPFPETYLNQKRWNDEISPAPEASTAPIILHQRMQHPLECKISFDEWWRTVDLKPDEFIYEPINGSKKILRPEGAYFDEKIKRVVLCTKK